MLLNEIIEPKIINKTVDKPIGDSSRKGEIDSGKYSTVKNDNDPHMIKKSSKRARTDLESIDPYWTFIKKLVDSGIASRNPYFPRIYNITSLKGADEKEIRRAKMEKLLSYADLHDADVPLLKIISERINANLNDLDDLDVEIDPVGAYISIISDKIDNLLRNYGINELNDDSLIEAIYFIRNMIKENHFMVIDMHTENIMFRRGSYGLQLVITDPVCGYKQ